MVTANKRNSTTFSADGNSNDHSIDQVIGLLQGLKTAVDELRLQISGTIKSHYTVDEVAKLTGRAPYTVRKWIKGGLIAATRVHGTGPNGRLLVPRDQLAKIVNSGHGAEVHILLPGDSSSS